MAKITLETIRKIREALPEDQGRLVANALMHNAFDKLKVDDWRAPIDTVLNEDLLDFHITVVMAAIEYITATKATVRELPNGNVEVKAKGYRAGPAGP